MAGRTKRHDPEGVTLASMTGFARVEASHGAHHWAWELRSVNGKGLDMRVRVPSGLEVLEQEARKRAAARFKRGSLQIGLQIARSGGAATLSVNRDALDQVLSVLAPLRERVPDAPAPALEGILSLRGVLDVQEPEESEEERAARMEALTDSLEKALEALETARAEEGRALTQTIGGQIATLETLVDEAASCAAAQPDRLRERLRLQVSALLEDQALSEERLHQEAALLMTKADITEELDRLRAHAQAARDLLAGGGAVGRRFDFLSQEFNREANTLCSKSSDLALPRIGLELKAVIDQMREQIQNVE